MLRPKKRSIRPAITAKRTKPRPVSKDEVKKLQREIRRFNNQVSLMSRLTKGQLDNILPNKISFEPPKTRQEMKEIRERLRDVRSYKDLAPVQVGTRLITRSDKARIERKNRKVNVQAKKLLETVQLKAKEMGRFPNETSLLVREIGLENADPRNYERLLDWLSNESSQNLSEQWRQNYLRALDRQREEMILKGLVGPELERAMELNNQIYRIVSSMNLSDFLVAQLAYGGELSIGFIYPLDEFVPRLERMLDGWQEVS